MAKDTIRRQRVESRDQMDPSLFEDVLKTQTSDDIRKSVATDILLNEGTEEELKQSVFELVQKWKKDKLF
jgi:dephospho-CoA kinase